jgi:RimJ/RimL family protein N-acetyltransferase
MIELRLITDEDVAKVKNWPSYTDEFEAMDYALRKDGWLDEYRERPMTWIYVAELDKQTVGFSLLSTTGEGEAEFRIAIHSRWIGKGLGKKIAFATLKKGFRQLNLTRIHLIVRKENKVASKLYESLGFIKSGESTRMIQGKIIEFINMNLTKEDFDSHVVHARTE